MTLFNCRSLELCGTYACSTAQRRQLRWSPMRFRPSLDSSLQINGLSGGMLCGLCGPSVLLWHLFSRVASADPTEIHRNCVQHHQSPLHTGSAEPSNALVEATWCNGLASSRGAPLHRSCW